jgi:hypothetical protein
MKCFTIVLLLILTINSYAKGVKKEPSVSENSSVYKRVYNTQHLSLETPNIDGKLNDLCWAEGEWSETYTQNTPVEGAVASLKTQLKVLFDDKNIYVAIKCFESDMSKIHRFKGNRDELKGDIVGVCFDSYFDKRTGYEFDITAAGGQIDLILNNDGNPDFSWNAVWYGETALEDSAWTAEMRIPLSQLRYNNTENQVWGMHSWRWIDRMQEEDQWSLIPRMNTGFVYNFGELHGINNLPKSRRVELLPYTVGKSIFYEKERGNPFSKGNENNVAFGLDGKVGLGSNFTADFTINPDFGQVEADPSVMNLSAFETYFDEKRPFFLEGKSIFNYDLNGSQVFYSRRIGHAPSYSPDLNDGDYSKNPDNTSIISALKVSGKTENGLSVGVLQALTAKEYVDVSMQNETSKLTSEPMANYTVGRIQKDYNKGNTIIGGIFTSSNRFINEDYLNDLNKNAYTGGIDYIQYFGNRNYSVSVKSMNSYIQGDKKAITDLQQSSAHYYQRPDAGYLKLDTNRTSLSGWSGNVRISKGGTSKWNIAEQASWSSPGFDMNDMGFMNHADYLKNDASALYIENTPVSIFKTYNVGVFSAMAWTYGGETTSNMVTLHTEATFKNSYHYYFNVNRVFSAVDPYILQGGPALSQNPFWCVNGGINSDWSKRVAFSFGYHQHIYSDNYSKLHEFYPSVSFRLSSSISLETSVNYSRNYVAAQYVETVNNNYIMARLNQETLGLTFRLNYSITSGLTIQYYGNPFISKGLYSQFKKVIDPRNSSFGNRFHVFSSDSVMQSADRKYYTINNNGSTLGFDNPDFTSRAFHSNLVAKWEFKKGAFLYLVWAHQKSSSPSNTYVSSFNENVDKLYNSHPENIYLLKFNYYFSL